MAFTLDNAEKVVGLHTAKALPPGKADADYFEGVEVNEIDTAFDVVRAGINADRARLDTAESSISSHGGRLTTAEAAVAAHGNMLDGTEPINAAKVQATSSTTARPLDERFADEIHLKDFGAACDGATNDRAALVAAIAAIGAADKALVLHGTCNVLPPVVTIPANITVRVAGGGGFTGGGAALTGGTPTSVARHPHDLEVHHLIRPLAPALQDPFFPLGNDLMLQVRGPADLVMAVEPHDTTASTSVTAGAGRVITVASTANFGGAATSTGLFLDPGTASEELVPPGSWSITDATTITATVAKDHTAPYTVRQEGSVAVASPKLWTNADDPLKRGMTLVAAGGVQYAKLPSDTSAPFPASAVQIAGTVTGAAPTTGDLTFRHSKAGAALAVVAHDNSATNFVLGEASGGAARLAMGNPTNFPFIIEAYADAPRIYGGGTSNSMILYTHGTIGPTGMISFRGPDEAEVFRVGTAGVNGPYTYTPVHAEHTKDIEITDTARGVILKGPDGTRYRIKVANGGALSTEVVP
jgi:hypothetical protein